MRFLVTGAAGFIGFHVCKKLCHAGFEVIGLDNLNNYYDILLKKARLEQLKLNTNFKFIKLNLTDKKNIDHLFCKEKFNRVIHLAAQAGVRYSLENPMAYADSNLTGHLTILESCRQYGTEHLVYASSSSVYGSNTRIPFSVTDNTDHAISLYAATKKANEVMSHAYAHLYNFPATGLRFFTVYGPWGRPDMALFKFTTAMCQGKEIDIYNHGRLSRDFTYIDDIVEGIMRIQSLSPGNTTISSIEPNKMNKNNILHRLYNIGYGKPVELMTFIKVLEKELGIKAKINFTDMQQGDIHATWADTTALFSATGYQPQVDIETGIRRFVKWYKSFYHI